VTFAVIQELSNEMLFLCNEWFVCTTNCSP